MAFAKRQRTWFRGEEGVEWLPMAAARDPARWDALATWLRG
jgi:tRNA A37 N6-isopentenylltransferase MiaA